MFRELRSSISLFIVLFALTGFGYPILMLLLGQNLFPYQSNGSLIIENEKIIGSSLIGQNFASEGYFHSRPSAAGNGYDAGNSSGSNLGPTRSDLMKAVSDRAADISPDAARFQVARVATARQLNPLKVEELVSQSIIPRTFSILGDNRVNVLDLNRKLDQLASTPPSP